MGLRSAGNLRRRSQLAFCQGVGPLGFFLVWIEPEAVADVGAVIDDLEMVHARRIEGDAGGRPAAARDGPAPYQAAGQRVLEDLVGGRVVDDPPSLVPYLEQALPSARWRGSAAGPKTGRALAMSALRDLLGSPARQAFHAVEQECQVVHRHRAGAGSERLGHRAVLVVVMSQGEKTASLR